MVDDVFGIIGTTLAGTFHVEEVIAEGGFGVVYRAEHGAFRAPVALKCLKIPGTVSRNKSAQLMESFREEAEILFHLSAHIPEVVRPLHADMMALEDGTVVPYIAMEWIEGRPLDSIIIVREDEGLPPLSIGAVIKMLTPIAHALAKAHRFQVPGGAIVSVTHCDLKPENIVITDHGRPVRAKILDFGIARARDLFTQTVGKMTQSSEQRPFTPSYGAPEQWVPKRYGQTGPWTDVWGLGLTMVECLTGNPPIDGDMHAMMGTALDPNLRPTPGNEGATVSPEVEAVFEKALAVDPRKRFKSVERFWTALEQAHELKSSFARARKRRQRATYDDDSLDVPDSSRPSRPSAVRVTALGPPRAAAAAIAKAKDLVQEMEPEGGQDSMEFSLETEEPAIMRRQTKRGVLPSLHDMPAERGLPSRTAHDPLGSVHDSMPPASGSEFAPISEPPTGIATEFTPLSERPPGIGSEAQVPSLSEVDALYDDEDPNSDAFDRETYRAPSTMPPLQVSAPSSVAPDSFPARDSFVDSIPARDSFVDSMPVRDSMPDSLPISSVPRSRPSEDELGMPLPKQPKSMPPRAFELDMPSAPPPAKPRAAVTSRTGVLERDRSQSRDRLGSRPDHDQPRDIKQLLRLPAVLLMLALVLTVADISIAASVGGTLSLGPVKIRWISVAFACAGIGLAARNLMMQDD